MKRPIVLLDVDGPLADFIGGCKQVLVNADLHEAARGLRVDRNIFDGLTDEAGAILRNGIEAPGFAAGLEVHAHAQEAVRVLSSFCEVVYVTAPWIGSATWASERAAWLAEHFGARKGQVISTHAKWLVRGDIFVDDHLPNVREWAFGNEGATALWTAQSDEERSAAWHVVLTIARAKAGSMTRYVVRNSAGRYLDATAPGAGRVVGMWCRSFRNAFVFRSQMLAESFAESWRSSRSGDKSARVEVLP